MSITISTKTYKAVNDNFAGQIKVALIIKSISDCQVLPLPYVWQQVPLFALIEKWSKAILVCKSHDNERNNTSFVFYLCLKLLHSSNDTNKLNTKKQKQQNKSLE